jgi:CspA family cold shock protein
MDGYKTLKAGRTVTFEKKPSDKGVHAVNIVPDEVPVRQPAPDHDLQSSDGSPPGALRDDYQPRAVNA